MVGSGFPKIYLSKIECSSSPIQYSHCTIEILGLKVAKMVRIVAVWVVLIALVSVEVQGTRFAHRRRDPHVPCP